MRVISVRAGSPREFEFDGRRTLSAINKAAVEGSINVSKTGLEGDSQVESGHGGPFRAVYAYSLGGYEFWMGALGRTTLDQGVFGENLTIEGLIDAEVCSGDRLRVGTTELIATTPRIPCFKLEMKLQAQDVISRYLAADWPGIYFMVTLEGRVQQGDSAEWVHREENGVTIVDLMRTYSGSPIGEGVLEKASNLQTIPPEWQARIDKCMQRVAGSAT